MSASEPALDPEDLAALSDRELIKQYCSARARMLRVTNGTSDRQAAARAEDEQNLLFGELWERYKLFLQQSVRNHVRGFCPPHLSGDTFAGDCLGAVSEKLVDGICAYEGGSLKAYLKEVAKNTVIDCWRHEVGRAPTRRTFKPIDPDGNTFRSTHTPDPQDIIQQLDRSQLLVKLLALHVGSSRHGRKSGCAIASRVWADRSFDEIAQKRRSTLAAVYKMFSRDYRELQNLADRLGIRLSVR